MRRIGVLLGTDESNPEERALKEAFVHGLQKFGWTAGSNVMIDYRWGGGDREFGVTRSNSRACSQT